MIGRENHSEGDESKMKRQDLLFLENAGEVSDSIFEDMNFSGILQSALGVDEALCKTFLSVLRCPIRDVETLIERQRILMDFLEYPRFADEILAWCSELAPYRLTIKPGMFRENAPGTKLDYYLSQTLPLLEAFDRFPKLLTGKHFRSRTLGTYWQESCGKLSEYLKAASRAAAGDSLNLFTELGDGYKLARAKLCHTDHVDIIPIYNKKTKETVIQNEEYFLFDGFSMAQFIVEDIRKSTVLNLCSAVSSIHAAVMNFAAELRLAAVFYRLAIKLKSKMEMLRLPLCMPEIRSQKQLGIRASGLYDLSLALRHGDSDIVGNDVDFEESSVLLVTGYNRGGKTTFLRSIGIAQLLAQSGLFVPAQTYSCPAYTGILSHFPSAEDSTLAYGKLADELMRFRKDFPILQGGGLALFNESFATTTAQEGADIGFDILRAVKDTGSHAVFVTHLCELAARREALGGTVSLTTEPSRRGKPTYKIVKGEPIENTFASDFL